MPVDFSARRTQERQSRASLADWQLTRLNSLLRKVLPHNRFYEAKLADVELPLRALDQLRDWPLTTKEELVSGPRAPGYDPAPRPMGAADLGPESELARNLTYPLERYVRYHRTSVVGRRSATARLARRRLPRGNGIHAAPWHAPLATGRPDTGHVIGNLGTHGLSACRGARHAGNT